MNIVDFLSSPNLSPNEYVVGLVEPSFYDENNCTSFAMWMSFYNSDWMMDFIQTWASKFANTKDIVIYRRTTDENGKAKFYRLYHGSPLARCITEANLYHVYCNKWFTKTPLN